MIRNPREAPFGRRIAIETSLSRDGTRGIVSASSAPVRDAAGKIVEH
jgi:hypothetical protein